MRVLMVDREPVAQGVLGRLLAAMPGGPVVDMADNGVEALEKLDKGRYDLLLLDLRMPDLSDLLDFLKARRERTPAVALTGAPYEQVVAFDARLATRPSTDRTGDGLDMPRRRRGPGRGALEQSERTPRMRVPKVGIKSSGRILFIDPREVRVVRAEGNYVSLERQAGADLLREPISVVAEKLRAYGFVQIHRSVLVNASLVEEVRARPGGEYGLRIRGGKEYIVTRTYKKNLKALAEAWIGVSPLLVD